MDKYLDKECCWYKYLSYYNYISKYLNVIIEIKYSVRYINPYLDYTYRYFPKYIMELLLLNLDV